MDFILSKVVIPRSTKSCYIIRPFSSTFVTGISKQYSFTYDQDLLGDRMSEDDFQQMVAVFNNALTSMWPCNLVLSLGYLFALFTCGLSFLLPMLCIRDAEKNLQN